MSWTYRPCKIVHEDGSEHWDIRAFYTFEDGGAAWSAEAAYPFGETLEELKSDLSMMKDDVEGEPLVLFVYTCTKCGEKDARPDKGRCMCEKCLNNEKSST